MMMMIHFISAGKKTSAARHDVRANDITWSRFTLVFG